MTATRFAPTAGTAGTSKRGGILVFACLRMHDSGRWAFGSSPVFLFWMADCGGLGALPCGILSTLQSVEGGLSWQRERRRGGRIARSVRRESLLPLRALVRRARVAHLLPRMASALRSRSPETHRAWDRSLDLQRNPHRVLGRSPRVHLVPKRRLLARHASMRNPNSYPVLRISCP